jgi:hypothetical protein
MAHYIIVKPGKKVAAFFSKKLARNRVAPRYISKYFLNLWGYNFSIVHQKPVFSSKISFAYMQPFQSFHASTTPILVLKTCFLNPRGPFLK